MIQNEIVIVASVSIIKGEEVLIIKENKPSAIQKWNFPSGRIEPGEDILYAARREVKEETGYDVKLISTTGVYNFISSTNHQVIMFHFVGEITGGSLKIEEEQIIDSKWIKVKDLIMLDNKELREAAVINQIVKRLLNKEFYSMNIFNPQLPHNYFSC